MSSNRYDLVIYGATGFTGTYSIEVLLKSKVHKEISWAVSGRNRSKLEKVLHEVSQRTGEDLSKIPIIIADTKNGEELVNMAKQAKVIVNFVGPYISHGESVIKAAVENGASHVDISGETDWIQEMQLKYHDSAKKNGVYIIGACGFDSIPCDLGVNFLKQNFPGTLAYVETFVQDHRGSAGYSLNTGTYNSLVLALSRMPLGQRPGGVEQNLITEKVQESKFKPPKRGLFWKNRLLNAYALPFEGTDNNIVIRSQHYDAANNKTLPVSIMPYVLVESVFWASLLMLWLVFMAIGSKITFIKNFLLAHPEFCSNGLFKESGPSREQTSFTYWIFGTGWGEDETDHEKPPKRKIVARCDGKDPAYRATSGCALSAALTILKDRDNLPENGGVYTTASAFKNTKIYDILDRFEVTFRMAPEFEDKELQ